jgi:hypothetical protein
MVMKRYSTLSTYDEEPAPENRPARTGLRVIGIIIIIVGLSIFLIGLSQYSANSNMSPGDEDFGQKSDATFNGFAMMAGGGFMAFFGGMLVYVSFLGRVATYMARETRPAVRIAGSGLGQGVAEGIREGGGIEVDHNNEDEEDEEAGSGKKKEVIRIKCRECGFLETEDAEFCSKCGKRM